MKAVEAVLGDGEGSVTDQIADAEQRAKDAASEDATTKANQALADAKTYTNEEVAKDRARLEALETDTHKHTNLELLETYTQTEADLADAVAKKHEHANADVLNGIDADDVTKWDNAEQNAKDYADGQINTAIEEAKTDASNKDAVVLAEAQKGIAAVQTSVDGVAEDVADHESRLAAIEEIEFVEASEDDILGMFNTTA